jgi:hypothetical protein
MPLDYQGRIIIRKHRDGRWRVKRIRLGSAYTIYVAYDFDGIRNYMDMRRKDW